MFGVDAGEVHMSESTTEENLGTKALLKLEGAQRVHISAKWILHEITGLKDIRITTLNSKGHVTS